MSALYPPLLIQVALTFTILTLLGVGRFSRKGDPDVKAAVAAGESPDYGRTTALLSDNLKNQFEVPVLFYAGILTALSTETVTPLLVGLAWFFAITRIIHAAIHITINVVLVRFAFYLSGASALIAYWIVLGSKLMSS